MWQQVIIKLVTTAISAIAKESIEEKSSVMFDYVKIAKNLLVDNKLAGTLPSTNNQFAREEGRRNVVIEREGVWM